MSHVVDQPATPGGDAGAGEPHSHPLPPSVRLALVAYGLLFPLVLGALGFLLLAQAQEDERDRARAKAANAQQVEQVRSELAAESRKLAAELDRRTAARNRADARDRERTRVAVCTVVADSLRPSEGTRRLAEQLRCGLPPLPEPSPEPAPTVQAPSPMVRDDSQDDADESQPQAQPEPSPDPPSAVSPTQRPTTRPSPRPTPTPSPSCVRLPIVRCLP